MEKSSFFGSIGGDRRYKAEDWAAYFASFIANGVFPDPSTGLQVLADGETMQVTVSAGSGWINGYYYRNTSDLILPLAVADGVLARMDRVVLRWDLAQRSMYCTVKTGTPASSPAAPALQRDADGWELCLADVLIPAGAIAQSQSGVTDQRLNTELCGIVHGVVDQVDTETLALQLQTWMEEFRSQTQQEMDDFQSEKEAEINQFQQETQDQFLAWFQTLRDVLDEETATNLYNLITTHTSDRNNPHAVTAAQTGAATTGALESHTGNTSNPHAVTAAQVGAATTGALESHTGNTSNPHAVTAAQTGAATVATYTATLLASGWTGDAAPYSQAVSVTGLLATDTPFIDIVQTGTEETDSLIREAWGLVTRAVAAANSLTAYASEVPGADIPVQIICVR